MKKYFKILAILPALALLMAPTGGYPSRPTFQKVVINETANSTNTLAVVAPSDVNGANIQMLGNGGSPSKFLRAQNGIFQILNNAYSGSIFQLADAGNATLTATSGTGLFMVNGGTSPLIIDAASTTPTSGWSAFSGNLTMGTSGGDYPYIAYNATATTTTGLTNYRITDFASRLKFGSGGFQFQTAPSGTAAAAITYTDALTITPTQMTLEPSSGGVVVGAPTGGSKGTGTVNATALYQGGVQTPKFASVTLQTPATCVFANANNISACGRSSAGNYTFTISAGFTATPVCVAGPISVGITLGNVAASASSTTAGSLNIINSAGSAIDLQANVVCVGV